MFRTRRGEVTAVAGVDLSVRGGEIFGLLGPNGAGKSTTMRMLVTLVRPTSGEAEVAGYDITRYPQEVRRSIGYVPQGGCTFPAETGRDELIAQGMAFGLGRARAKQRASELLDRFQLGEVADRRIGTWSGGQRRRLDIAIGMVQRPEVLFLDEPTTGLDPQSRANLWQQIRALRDEGTAIVLTTHYLDEADALSDHLVIIDHGRVVAAGTTDDMKRSVKDDVVSVGVGGQVSNGLQLVESIDLVHSVTVDDGLIRAHVTNGRAAAIAILRVLEEAGFPCTSLEVTQPTLDDVFLATTGRSLRD
jgi:ABC-2 type transport system ATP-binding protein